MVVALNFHVGGQSDLEASASAERRHMSLNHKAELDDERTANEELRAQLRKFEQQVQNTQSELCLIVAFDQLLPSSIHGQENLCARGQVLNFKPGYDMSFRKTGAVGHERERRGPCWAAERDRKA